MPDHLHIRTLFNGGAIEIFDVACRAQCSQSFEDEWVESHEIVIPRRGVFIKEVGRRHTIVDANYALFLPPRQTYRVSHPVPGGDDCTVFKCADSLVRQALHSYDPGANDRTAERVLRIDHGPLDPQTLGLVYSIRRHALAPTCDRLAIEETTIALIDHLIYNAHAIRGLRPAAARKGTRRAHSEFVERVRALVAADYQSNHSLAAIASAVHCSPYHLARIFRRHTGLSICRYRRRLRLADAADRIARGQSDLTAMALELGFSSHSHFSAAFRREFAVPPTEFRSPLGGVEVPAMDARQTN